MLVQQLSSKENPQQEINNLLQIVNRLKNDQERMRKENRYAEELSNVLNKFNKSKNM